MNPNEQILLHLACIIKRPSHSLFHFQGILRAVGQLTPRLPLLLAPMALIVLSSCSATGSSTLFGTSATGAALGGSIARSKGANYSEAALYSTLGGIAGNLAGQGINAHNRSKTAFPAAPRTENPNMAIDPYTRKTIYVGSVPNGTRLISATGRPIVVVEAP